MPRTYARETNGSTRSCATQQGFAAADAVTRRRRRCEVGLGDLDILDLSNIVAYYCYIKRGERAGLLTEIPAEHVVRSAK
jgi:hypothetical protein